jgi:antitoxin component of RelBE/YafQ-DinJ toxin-antitoxin module
MSKAIYARVSDEVHDRVTEVAQESGVTIAAVVNWALRRSLNMSFDSIDATVNKLHPNRD